MTKKILVAPSILSGDFAAMGSSVSILESWGADLVHCDVMDGVYVNNITFGMPMIKAIKPLTKLPLDVHLMITTPEKYVVQFIECGANYLSFHPEVSTDPQKTLSTNKSFGVKAGIVINADVCCENYLYLLKNCDFVLIMSVQAGLGGQKFKPETLDKVVLVREYAKENNLSIDIEIDGGITEENVELVKKAGVNIIVAGSSIYKSNNPTLTIKKFKENARE
jgi:ribulose-phosphate 3-epimerase